MTSLSIINKWHKLTDVAIVAEIGKMIQEVRLQRNFSQSELARISGISRATISQLENGRPATLLTFVQVLRALNRFDVLSSMVQEPEFSPIMYAKLKGKKRKRASGKGVANNPETGDSSW
jgi:transcriptional regulator with XRE-family HTH domain